MKIPKRPTDPFEYTLKRHVGKENAPVFTLKPVPVGKFDEAVNLSSSGKQATSLRFLCHHGIKGWSNLEPEFTPDNCIELIDAFDFEWIAELGNKVLESSQVTETEKNS